MGRIASHGLSIVSKMLWLRFKAVESSMLASIRESFRFLHQRYGNMSLMKVACNDGSRCRASSTKLLPNFVWNYFRSNDHSSTCTLLPLIKRLNPCLLFWFQVASSTVPLDHSVRTTPCLRTKCRVLRSENRVPRHLAPSQSHAE
jgi:hypothetical protein